MNKISCESAVVERRRNLKGGYFALSLSGFKRLKRCKPGQFVHIRIPGSDVYLRRAFSVGGVDTEADTMEVILKVVGRGTRKLAEMTKGCELDLLGPLGNAFSRPTKKETAVIIAGGVGLPPLVYLAEELCRTGFDPGQIQFFYGGRTRADIIERARIKKLGCGLHITTDDGSLGTRGFVTQEVERYLDTVPDKKIKMYACGPEPMLAEVNRIGLTRGVGGELSLEAPMPCGFGVCLGCIVKLVQGGYARVCADGPIFEIGEVVL